MKFDFCITTDELITNSLFTEKLRKARCVWKNKLLLMKTKPLLDRNCRPKLKLLLTEVNL